MTIANVALWVYYTFSVKGVSGIDDRYYFYGDRLWSILNHLSLPLIMFYRFHASVCLVDIWRHSYEPAEAHHWTIVWCRVCVLVCAIPHSKKVNKFLLFRVAWINEKYCVHQNLFNTPHRTQMAAKKNWKKVIKQLHLFFSHRSGVKFFI